MWSLDRPELRATRAASKPVPPLPSVRRGHETDCNANESSDAEGKCETDALQPNGVGAGKARRAERDDEPHARGGERECENPSREREQQTFREHLPDESMPWGAGPDCASLSARGAVGCRTKCR